MKTYDELTLEILKEYYGNKELIAGAFKKAMSEVERSGATGETRDRLIFDLAVCYVIHQYKAQEMEAKKELGALFGVDMPERVGIRLKPGDSKEELLSTLQSATPEGAQLLHAKIVHSETGEVIDVEGSTPEEIVEKIHKHINPTMQ